MGNGATTPPRRPAQVSEYAVACLAALTEHGLAAAISLGGDFGLLHYLDYRPTHDVDAGWVESISAEDQRRAVDGVEATLRTHGQVRNRSWGDVVSIELWGEGKAVFSFQIARRSAQLKPSAPAPWTPVLLRQLS